VDTIEQTAGVEIISRKRCGNNRHALLKTLRWTYALTKQTKNGSKRRAVANPSTYLTGETKVYLCKNLKPLYAIRDLIDSQRATLTRRTFRIEEPQHTSISRYTSTRYFLNRRYRRFRRRRFICLFCFYNHLRKRLRKYLCLWILPSDRKNGTGQSFTQTK